MQVQYINNFKSPLLQFNGHLQTIVPSYFRENNSTIYTRERLYLKDGDFVDLDWVQVSNESENLIILTHGLEGNSERHYIKFQAEIFAKEGYNVLAWNCRSCSGELNLLPKLYYHGDIEDISEVIQYALKKKEVKNIYLIGFSMGGNIVLNYASSAMLDYAVCGVAAISFPGHLKSCVEKMDAMSLAIYSNKFRKNLIKKLRLKAEQFPDWLPFEKLNKVKTWQEFDELFSAPMTNHVNAKSFYEASSSILRLHHIKIPTLMIQAQNDPILSPESIPVYAKTSNNNMELILCKKGGHLGFMVKKSYYSWSELKILKWVNNLCVKVNRKTVNLPNI